MESPLAPNPHSRTPALLPPPSLISAATPTNPSHILLPSVLLPLPGTSHPSPVSDRPELLLLLRPRMLHPEHAGSDVRREAPEQFSHYRGPPYSRNPWPTHPTAATRVRAQPGWGKQRRTRAGSAMEGGSLAGAAGVRRSRWFRYLTALVNVLGLVQQLSLGQDKHISWIQHLEIVEDSTKETECI